MNTMNTPEQDFTVLAESVNQLKLIPHPDNHYNVESIAYFSGVNAEALIQAAVVRAVSLMMQTPDRPDWVWADGLLAGAVFQRHLLADYTIEESTHLHEIAIALQELCGDGQREISEVSAIAGISSEAVILAASTRGFWLFEEGVNPPTVWADGFLVGTHVYRRLTQNTPENTATTEL